MTEMQPSLAIKKIASTGNTNICEFLKLVEGKNLAMSAPNDPNPPHVWKIEHMFLTTQGFDWQYKEPSSEAVSETNESRSGTTDNAKSLEHKLPKK